MQRLTVGTLSVVEVTLHLVRKAEVIPAPSVPRPEAQDVVQSIDGFFETLQQEKRRPGAILRVHVVRMPGRLPLQDR